MPEPDLILDGITVVSLEQAVAAPFAKRSIDPELLERHPRWAGASMPSGHPGPANPDHLRHRGRRVGADQRLNLAEVAVDL